MKEPWCVIEFVIQAIVTSPKYWLDKNVNKRSNIISAGFICLPVISICELRQCQCLHNSHIKYVEYLLIINVPLIIIIITIHLLFIAF